MIHLQNKRTEMFENNFLEERKNKVLEIFSEVAQEYMKNVLYPGCFSSPTGITIKNYIIQLHIVLFGSIY